MTFSRTLAGLTLCTLLAAPALAQVADVKVEGAWARASVPGQKGTGAFMKLTAPQGARLVSASSPAAGVTEVHEMKLDGDVMRMRAVPVLELPAGKPVELKPGGFHVMLLDLKAPLAKDSTVPLTLTFKDAKGVESRLDLTVPVATSAPGTHSAAPAHAHGHGHKH
ncbi:copper chaperone PCu(A)C [Acidovorax sp.]|uniref:copper chaperone PCu(A)C n=1 Tax=Acidovorax sp. TaxID=1872122 RepID=UPI002ACEF4BE|nr:copper chaperone PCu(A)C [Acidovorax sp.]MDZ7861696.1 copper chaperone PCu(A)C [Acidovorax sp.]